MLQKECLCSFLQAPVEETRSKIAKGKICEFASYRTMDSCEFVFRNYMHLERSVSDHGQVFWVCCIILFSRSCVVELNLVGFVVISMEVIRNDVVAHQNGRNE